MLSFSLHYVLLVVDGAFMPQIHQETGAKVVVEENIPRREEQIFGITSSDERLKSVWNRARRMVLKRPVWLKRVIVKAMVVRMMKRKKFYFDDFSSEKHFESLLLSQSQIGSIHE